MNTAEYAMSNHRFSTLLQKGGLIEIDTVEGESYLPASQLYDVERYTRMYYDLSINIEGIDAIHHLLAGGIPATGS